MKLNLNMDSELENFAIYLATLFSLNLPFPSLKLKEDLGMGFPSSICSLGLNIENTF